MRMTARRLLAFAFPLAAALSLAGCIVPGLTSFVVPADPQTL